MHAIATWSALFGGVCAGVSVDGSPDMYTPDVELNEWGFRQALAGLVRVGAEEAHVLLKAMRNAKPTSSLLCDDAWPSWLEEHAQHLDAGLQEAVHGLRTDWSRLSESPEHAGACQAAATPALQACIEAFDSGWFGSLSGAAEVTRDMFVQGSRRCVEEGAVAVAFSPGIGGVSGGEVLDTLLSTTGLNGHAEVLRQLQSFLVCMPQEPVCIRDHERVLGWHYFLRHVLVVPDWLLNLPVPAASHVWSRSDSLDALDELREALAERGLASADLEPPQPMPVARAGGRACQVQDDVLHCCTTETSGFDVPWRGADEALPDFDCLSNPLVQEIFELVDMLTGTLILYTETGSARFSSWEGEDAEREVWMNYADKLFGFAEADEAASDEALEAECPAAFFALQISRWAVCLFLGIGAYSKPKECLQLRVSLGDLLLGMPWGLCRPREALPVLLNTRWLFAPCSLMLHLRLLVQRHDPQNIDPDGELGEEFDCRHERGNASINWNEYGGLVDEGRVDYTDNSTVSYWTLHNLYGSQVTTAGECLLGLTTMMLEKLRLAQAGRTEDYAQFADSVGILFAKLDALTQGRPAPQDSLGVMLASRWPIPTLFCSIGFQAQAHKAGSHPPAFGYQHKPYDLDFDPDEILRPPEERRKLVALRAMPLADHIRVLRRARGNRPSSTFRSLLAALIVSLQEAASQGLDAAKLVVVSIVWGSRLAVYFDGWLRRAAAFGLAHNSMLFCLDDDACTACRAVHPFPTHCVPGRLKTIYNKYTVISAIINSGLDAIYLDFDTVMLGDPMPSIRQQAAEAEVLVSADFGCECLNTGVIYFKAHPDVADFLSTLLVWLWHHPYEFSQKAFSAMLGKENVSQSPLGVPVPRWRVLDRYTEFVTSLVYNPDAEGWTGHMGDIVIYHFLDGTGGVDPDRAVAGKYLNLYDLFYANEMLNLSDTATPLWKQDARVEESLQRSWKPARPTSLLPCMLLPSFSFR